MILWEILLQTSPFYGTGFKICQPPLFAIVSGSYSWWQDNDELKKLVQEVSLPFQYGETLESLHWRYFVIVCSYIHITIYIFFVLTSEWCKAAINVCTLTISSVGAIKSCAVATYSSQPKILSQYSSTVLWKDFTVLWKDFGLWWSVLDFGEVLQCICLNQYAFY